MTHESEQKIYDALMDFKEDQATFNATMISEVKQMKLIVLNHEKSINELEAIKYKAIGAMWLAGIFGGTGFISGIAAFLYSIVKHS